ncbi:glycosyltransferase [Nocardia sp. NPDC019395]|uniref:glycosyltransferase n=1 Tax=Nocardia sp. NPDC019395 TaxID=3154686 RepID=UPI0034005FC7
MRVFYFTKFPPLQGGMSARGLFTALELGRRGHEVHIFSDPLAAASHERVNAAPLRELFDYVDHKVTIHFAETDEHIFYRRHPGGRPAVSQLASLALSVTDEHRPDVIFGSFMEPYGIAAYLVSKVTATPLVATHAGSDIGRLMRARDSQFLYRQVFLDSSAVLTTPRHSAYLALMGVPARKLHALPVPAPAWAPNAPAAPHDGPPTVLMYGKLPTDDSYIRHVIEDCAHIGVRTEVIGHIAWPASNSTDDATTLPTSPFVWPWKIPGLISESGLVAALRSSGNAEVQHHHGLTPVEAAAMGRAVALHPSDAANFHMTKLGLPTSHTEMMKLLGAQDARRELIGLGQACFDWLQEQLASGVIGLVPFETYADRVERVLSAPDEPADDRVVADRVTRLLKAHIPKGADTQEILRERRQAYRPSTASLHHIDSGADARIVRRVPMRYLELPEQQFHIIAQSAGSHPHEHIVAQSAMALLEAADGSPKRAELDPDDITLLHGLMSRGLIAVCDADLLPSKNEVPSLSRIEPSHG